ncbi:hypothetical protein NMY22_g5691 [Coprinellus aureogranulatus]|nr:hypothetical protein NMY22_g5691 [Coprinellus aureogranulatus]
MKQVQPRLPRPNKRPLSPSSHSHQDQKRRVLGHASTSARSSSPKFADQTNFASVLHGPDSPARVLDFGASKDADLERTPRSKGLQNMELSPSPKLRGNTKAPSSGGSCSVAKDPFDFPKPTPAPTRHLPQHPLVFELVPRELPPLVDPESIHYPGFHVHRDPYTVVARQDTSRALDIPMDVDEEEKENVREVHSLKTNLAPDIKPDSMITVSPDKGVIRVVIDGTKHLTLNHKRIFANGFEDDIVDYTMLSPRRSPRLANSAALLDDGSPRPFGWRPRGGSGLAG